MHVSHLWSHYYYWITVCMKILNTLWRFRIVSPHFFFVKNTVAALVLPWAKTFKWDNIIKYTFLRLSCHSDAWASLKCGCFQWRGVGEMVHQSWGAHLLGSWLCTTLVLWAVRPWRFPHLVPALSEMMLLALQFSIMLLKCLSRDRRVTLLPAVVTELWS